jgi:hypothetical protein
MLLFFVAIVIAALLVHTACSWDIFTRGEINERPDSLEIQADSLTPDSLQIPEGGEITWHELHFQPLLPALQGAMVVAFSEPGKASLYLEFFHPQFIIPILQSRLKSESYWHI